MNIYFIIMIGIHLLNLGIALGRHGEHKVEKYNFWTQLIGSTIGITLLYLAVKTGF